MKNEICPEAKKTLSYEARRLKNASSILASLADTVSRDATDYLDVPRELRRTAVSLEDGARTLERIASVELLSGISTLFHVDGAAPGAVVAGYATEAGALAIPTKTG